jgi:hypothetical protein
MSSSDSNSDSEIDLTEQDNNSVIDLTEENITQQDSSDTDLDSEDIRITVNPENEELPRRNPELIRENTRVLFSPRPRTRTRPRIPLPSIIPDEQDITTANLPRRFSIYPYHNSIPVPEPTEEKEIINPIYIECIACKEKMINTICYPCQHAILCCGCARAWGQLQNICPLCKVGIVSIERIYFHYTEYQISPSPPPPPPPLSPPAPTKCARCNKRAKRILKRIDKNLEQE